ncbi:MAG: aldose 1-epimerase, partial [Thermoanaerobaculia bacterium]|nr:aldose 1-epimerase [Thermoanaerobaculia bacterium]
MIEIRSGRAIASIAPESCGAVTRFGWERPGGAIEWLRPASRDAIESAFPQGMSCFPLVPFSNRIRNGRFSFRGREITLPPNFPPEPHAIHGQGWRSSWNVVDHGETAAVIEYAHEPDDWPYRYRAQQTFRVTPTGLALEMLVKNEGDDAMPLGFGFHLYFVRTSGSRLRTFAEKMWEPDENAMPSRLVDPPNLDPLDPNAIELDDNFIGWSGQATIEW